MRYIRRNPVTAFAITGLSNYDYFFTMVNALCVLCFVWRYVGRLDLSKCLIKVIDDVVNVLNTNAEAHGRGSDVLLGQLLG